MIQKMRLTASAIIIAVIILIVFVLSVPHTRDVADLTETQEVEATPIVTLTDSYRKGVRTLSGSLLASNACTSVSAGASLINADTEAAYVLLELTTEGSEGVCLELPTDIEFNTTVEAPDETPITVTVNGTLASTTAS